MDELWQAFEERLQEIEAYLELLDALETQVQEGPPRLGTTGPPITVQQQRILYSSVYLQLYNLIEATITRCVDAVCTAVMHNGRWQPSDLSLNLRQEWVRFTARTHIELNYEHRLENALQLCDHLIQALPVTAFQVEKGGGGNWDDLEIEHITNRRLGFPLRLSTEAYRIARRPFRDDKGPLAFIKSLRNNLAHGSLSFVECGEGVTVHDLRDLKQRTVLYLREIVACFRTSIDTYQFLQPDRRPEGADRS